MGMLMMASFMTSCDNHEPYDPDLHIGYVLCDDHTCMDTATYFNQSKRKAVGVVFAEKTKDHPVLAVNLEETSGMFCDSIGMENGTSGDITSSMASPIPLPCIKAMTMKLAMALR